MSPTDRDARRRSEARLAAVLGSIDDHLVSYDTDWRCTYVSSKAAEMVGHDAGDMVGRNIWALFPDLVGGPYYEAVHRAVREQVKVRAEHHSRVNGRWYENHIYPSLDGVTVFTADITWRKEADSVRLQAESRKDEFLATLAHELRNPLAPISNAVHVLRMMAGMPSDATRLLQLIEQNTASLVRLVDDLVEVSRFTRGKIDLRRERVDLRSVVTTAVDAARPTYDGTGHHLLLKVPGVPVMVNADAMRLQQVVGNLLDNAVRYTGAGGRIDVSVGTSGDDACISVHDNGKGVPPERLSSIFEMFAQVEHNAGGQGGLGVGLALSRALMEMHGGTIVVRSEGAGRGSEFTVSLPLADVPAGADALAPPAVEPPTATAPAPRSSIPFIDNAQKPRILVVDDSRDAADSLGTILQLMGGITRVVYDGPEALAVIPEFAPDVILLDIGMPLMDGYEVARRIRQLDGTGRVRLIALTGWGQDAARKLSREVGFDDHWVKPVDPPTLMKLFESAVP